MSARTVDRCELCGGKLRTVLSLGSSPPACAMAKANGRRPAEKHYPLDLLYCGTCKHGQLGVIVHPSEVFPPDYPYASRHSRALRENFEDLARQAKWRLSSGEDLVVDIGANDGTLLSEFKEYRTIGVEPTGQADNISGPVYKLFFGEDVARVIRRKHGPARVITACNVMAHVPDLTDFMRGVKVLLADNGVFIAENHDLASVVNRRQWDTVYHEHARFFSPASFARLTAKFRLSVQNVEPIGTHGGSFRAWAGYSNTSGKWEMPEYEFDDLAADAARARRELRKVIGAWGIGATARATTIINYCGLDVEDVPCVCEVSGSDKIGRLIPGTRIPVVDEAPLFTDAQPPRVILFSWHLADSIVPKLRERGFKGEIIVPLTYLRSA